MRAEPVHHPATGTVPGSGGPPVGAARRGVGRRVALVLGLALACLLASVVPTAAAPSQADRVVRAVTARIGARYVHGATGPRAFDCSGLVFRAFKDAGLAKRIGGFSSAYGYYQRFRRKGRLSRVAPRVGDLVVYKKGGHIGIYVGGGKVVSALLSGVKRHPVRGLNIPFTGYLRVSLTRRTSPVVPASAKATKQRRVVIADRRLPVRANPGPGSSSIGVIRAGSRLVVYGTRKRKGVTWLRVRMTNGRRGWVNSGMTTPR